MFQFLLLAFHDATRGVFDEVHDEVALWACRQGFVDFLYRLAHVQAREEEQAIYFLNGSNLLRCESAAVEAHGVDTAVADRFASSDDVWRYVFVDA